MRKLALVFVGFALHGLMVCGCSKLDEKAASQAGESGASVRKEPVVRVPDIVRGKWKSVKIAVQDKTANSENVYTVELGGEMAVPGSNLVLRAETFLPHFIMDGVVLTSQTNEPKNPAVQVRISEGGKELFTGWLFTLYPTTNTFQNPRYSFALVDFIPSGK